MADNSAEKTKHTAGAFDIRTFIAALMGIYGVVLFLTGIFGGDQTTNGSKVAGNPNLYVGIALVVFSALMQGWALWRPTVVEEKELEADKQDGAPPTP
ncbi:MAG: hypothetical protein ABI873_09110 [Marmoricola sp.]